MAPPTILIVHGSWQTPAFYTPLITALQQRNHETLCPHLPSCNPALAPSSSSSPFAADVATLRTTISQLINNEAKSVVVVAHSYGGMVATDALGGLGLGRAERARDGKPGGVVDLIYMTAFVPRLGQSLAGLFGESYPPPCVAFSDDEIIISTIPDPAPWFYNDLPPDEAAFWATQVVPQPKSAALTAVTREAWREVRVSYIVCENDAAVPVAVQQMMADAIVEAGVPVTVERINASHSPFLSMPQVTAETIMKIIDRE